MELTDNEIRDITNLLEKGKSLPDKYRFKLFEEKREVELADFEAVKNQLRQEKFSKHMLKFIASLRKKSEIKYPNK